MFSTGWGFAKIGKSEKKITKRFEIVYNMYNTRLQAHTHTLWIEYILIMKKHTDEREHKDITCAVRLPQSLYQSLSNAAKITNSSLSDIMREAIVEKLDQIREQELARTLRRAEIEAKVAKLGLGTNSKSKAELEALLDLLEAS